MENGGSWISFLLSWRAANCPEKCQVFQDGSSESRSTAPGHLSLVAESLSLPLNEQKREKNLAPVFKGAIDAANFQAIGGVVDFQLLLATSALEQIAGASLSFGLLVIHADFGLPESPRVIEPVPSAQDFHLVLSLLCRHLETVFCSWEETGLRSVV
jgi:hypothetical protein